jgi:hypothetical protein
VLENECKVRYRRTIVAHEGHSSSVTLGRNRGCS